MDTNTCTWSKSNTERKKKLSVDNVYNFIIGISMQSTAKVIPKICYVTAQEFQDDAILASGRPGGWLSMEGMCGDRS